MAGGFLPTVLLPALLQRDLLASTSLVAGSRCLAESCSGYLFRAPGTFHISHLRGVSR